MTDPDKLTEIALKAVKDHEVRRSKVFLEAAVGQLVSSVGIEETQKILAHYSDHLEEFKK